MKGRLIVSVILFTIVLSGLAPAVTSQTDSWSEFFVATGNHFGPALVSVPDGYVLGTSTTSFTPEGRSKVWLIRLGASGDVHSETLFTAENATVLSSLRKTGDGGYILTV